MNMNITIIKLRVARSNGYAALLMICVRVMARYFVSAFMIKNLTNDR